MASNQPNYYNNPFISFCLMPLHVDNGLSFPTYFTYLVPSQSVATTIYEIRFNLINLAAATVGSTGYANLWLLNLNTASPDAINFDTIPFTFASTQQPPVPKYYRNLDLPIGWTLVVTNPNVQVTIPIGSLVAFGGQ